MAVCVNNLSLVILLMLSPSRNESENENKISQNRSVNIRVISYISNIWIIKICLKDWDFKFSLLKSTNFVLIYVLHRFYKILVI